jgi:cytochrome c
LNTKLLLLGVSSFLAVFLLVGCQETSHHTKLNGKKLIHEKCSACHNLDLPPKTFEDEKAPPMMAVAFHIKDFIPATNESEKIPKAIEFVKDYVINPSASKSFCDKKSLQTYGVMPSQKENVTQEELQAIGEYMFQHYTVKNLTAAQALQNKLNKLPVGERIALKNNCLGCHKKQKDLIGPSFHKIAQRYKNNTQQIIKSIKQGSVGHWEGYHGVHMPPFHNKIDTNNTQALTQWILSL